MENNIFKCIKHLNNFACDSLLTRLIESNRWSSNMNCEVVKGKQYFKLSVISVDNKVISTTDTIMDCRAHTHFLVLNIS